MKVLVCGSRDWGEVPGGYARILAAFASLPLEPTIIIHGAASRKVRGVEQSADMLADQAAQGFNWTAERHPADWKRHGRAAGPIRNREMLDREPDLVLAFQRNGSRGTQDTIDEARRRGIPVEVHTA